MWFIANEKSSSTVDAYRSTKGIIMRKTVLALAVGMLLSSSPASSQGFLGGLFAGKDTGKEADAPAVSAEATAFAQGQEEWARPFLQALYRDGEWGAVLNLNRLGLAAMEKQKFALARKSFDEAISRVEAIYAADENAVKARSVFNGEKIKDFKGEPYERSMLYYYRGLLYVQEGDYQNARASFLAADRHDTLSSAEDTSFAGKFGLMKYLAGWASACDNDTTRAMHLIEEARSVDSKIMSLPEKPMNSVVLIDSGPGPVKWGDGKYKEALKFKAGDGEDPSFMIRTQGGKDIADAILAGDVNYQATTRGGREIDAVMAGKAQFKENAGTVSNVSMQMGSNVAMLGAMSGNRDLAGAGLIGMFAGLVAKGIEQATTPAADVRSWDSLPGKIMLVTGPDIAKEPLQLSVANSAKALPIQTTNAACSLAWGRTRSALTSDMGGTVRFEESVPTEANRGDRNRAFRAMLVTELAMLK
jgi:tetratricopeptide (TPR) repeat protein